MLNAIENSHVECILAQFSLEGSFAICNKMQTNNFSLLIEKINELTKQGGVGSCNFYPLFALRCLIDYYYLLILFSGQVGSYESDLSPELTKKMDMWTEEKITQPLGIKFID